MCDCLNTRERIQTFKNGTTHIRVECIDCSRFIRYKQKELGEDTILHFGKHKGSRVKDIDKEYLKWLHKQDIKQNLKTLIGTLL
tara:strand:- start:1203 stop:1454 length:252 start_codon:yes stop_codon:yes gene_type:complete